MQISPIAAPKTARRKNKDAPMENGLRYLNELTWGYRASRVLQVAVGLKLFTYLNEQGRMGEELVALCSAKPELLEKVLML